MLSGQSVSANCDAIYYNTSNHCCRQHSHAAEIEPTELAAAVRQISNILRIKWACPFLPAKSLPSGDSEESINTVI